jgi:hypothetical protein
MLLEDRIWNGDVIMKYIQLILDEIEGMEGVSIAEFYELIVSVYNRLEQDQLPTSTSVEFPDRQG